MVAPTVVLSRGLTVWWVLPIHDLPARLNYEGFPTSAFPVVKKIVHRISIKRPCPAQFLIQGVLPGSFRAISWIS